jgi:NAD(P)-dependent dehydrogenase (short-subunit alcohol dehydrogenase family)
MSNDSQRLAVVTGGNRGLGLEVCRQLAKKGYRVVLTARDAEQARQAAASLASAGSVRAEQLDVTSEASVAAFADRARAELGPIFALVNNAGISMRGFNVDVVRGTLAVNFFGALRVTQALGPLVQDGGSIVMVSSGMGELNAYSPELRARFLDERLDVAGLRALVEEFANEVAAGTHEAHGWPSSAYRVSKAALNALTRILAKASSRVHVNSVCPGWVKTDMGGPGASRSVETGAAGIVWAATLAAGGPHGGFFRDGKPLDW